MGEKEWIMKRTTKAQKISKIIANQEIAPEMKV